MEWKDLENRIPIGEGSFGTIYRCEYAGKDVAVKVYKSNSDKFEQIFKSAMELAKKIRHPNLINCYDYFYDKVDNEIRLICALEYVNGIHLDKVKNVKYKLHIYLPQIAYALRYLHFNKVVHRDVKPENILVIETDEKVKLIDYDFLKRSDTGIFECKNGLSGTLLFSSPEIFERKDYTFAVDLWSLGVTLYSCLCREMPFLAKDRESLKQLILSDYEPDYSFIAKPYNEIIPRLLQKSPDKRITLKEILKYF